MSSITEPGVENLNTELFIQFCDEITHGVAPFKYTERSTFLCGLKFNRKITDMYTYLDKMINISHSGDYDLDDCNDQIQKYLQ